MADKKADQEAEKANKAMRWTKEHDVLLCREVLAAGAYKEKKGTNKAGSQWTAIASTLKKSTTVHFKPNLSQRAVRERFTNLLSDFKTKEKEELGASGISPEEQDELEQLLEDIVERERDASVMQEEKKKDEKAKGEDIRLQALETMGQTNKRKGEEREKTDKRRRSSNEALEFLQEKAAQETKLREEELKVKKKEEENKAAQFTSMQQQQNAMMEAFMQQQAQQQQQSQNLQVIMAQQNQAIMSLLGKFVSKQ